MPIRHARASTALHDVAAIALVTGAEPSHDGFLADPLHSPHCHEPSCVRTRRFTRAWACSNTAGQLPAAGSRYRKTVQTCVQGWPPTAIRAWWLHPYCFERQHGVRWRCVPESA